MKEEIRVLIGKNRISEAIKEMYAFGLGRKEKKSLALLESRFNELNQKIHLGILSEEGASLESNKIREGLLDVWGAMGNADADGAMAGSKKWYLIAAPLLLLAVSAYFFWGQGKADCSDRKVAILVADFQNTENDVVEDEEFANSLVTGLDALLIDDTYDVSPVGRQSRKVKRYDDFIRSEYFESSCDTSGLFINGLLSIEHRVFNVYITLANLQMKVPGLAPEKSINMDNPSGIEFSISNDAKFLCNFIHGIIKCYEGEPYMALEQFFELEKNDSNKIIQNDNNFKATVAYYKGNCYAMRGDNIRAKNQYRIAGQYGSPELKKVANNNIRTADEVNKKMKEDPELKLKLNEYKSEHSKFEVELQKALNNIGKELNKLFNKLKSK